MKNVTHKKFLAIAVLAILGASAQAATSNNNVSVSGTLVRPISCVVTIPASIDFGTRENGSFIEEPITVSVQCTDGHPYSISAPINTAVTIGPDTNYISLVESTSGTKTNIGSTPYTQNGNDAAQALSAKFQLHGTTALDSAVPSTSVGAFNAIVPVTLTY